MPDSPLSVALGIVEKDDKILLIQRDADNYDGYWALPGGKIEHSEHPIQAAVREIEEETGIKTTPERHEATVSEHISDQDKHFILHLCRLSYSSGTVTGGREGRAAWHPRTGLTDIDMVASDRKMLQELTGTDKTYATCHISSSDGRHSLETFTVQSSLRNERNDS